MGYRRHRDLEAGRAAVAPDKAFDKLALRCAFDRNETHLVVQCMGPLVHWRDDANSIVRMTERGRIRLFHNNKWPSRFHKNGVLVSSGFSAPPPRAARVDLIANFRNAAFPQTTLPGYRDTDCTRRMFWLRGGFTVAFDDVTIKQPGQYSATCVWRTPVEARIHGRRWTSRELGIDFHVARHSTMPASTGSEPMVGWEIGRRGSGRRQVQQAQALEGDAI